MINTSYSTGSQGFMAVSKQTSSSGYVHGSVYAFRLRLFTTIIPWHCAVTYTKLMILAICMQDLVFVSPPKTFEVKGRCSNRIGKVFVKGGGVFSWFRQIV